MLSATQFSIKTLFLLPSRRQWASAMTFTRWTATMAIAGSLRSGAAIMRRSFRTPRYRTRPHKLAGQVTEEVLQHLLDQPGAKVRISLEISADCPQGLDDNIRRTLRENCNTLGIDDYGIE